MSKWKRLVEEENERVKIELLQAMNIELASVPIDFPRTTIHIRTAKHNKKKLLEGTVLDLFKTMNFEIINTPDEDGYTMLHFVIMNSLESIASKLIEKMSSAAVSMITNKGYTALHFAIERGLETIIIDLINKMEPSSIAAITYDKGYTALHYATKKSLQTIAAVLIKEMTSDTINAVTNKGDTALHFAIENNLETLALKLVKRIDSRAAKSINEEGYTNLHLATKSKLEKVASKLIKNITQDSVLSISSKDGNTALHFAIQNGLEIVALNLIKKLSQSSINTANYDGDTPLLLAVEKGLESVAEELLQAGANPTNKNLQSNSALSLTLATGEIENAVKFISHASELTEDLSLLAKAFFSDYLQILAIVSQNDNKIGIIINDYLADSLNISLINLDLLTSISGDTSKFDHLLDLIEKRDLSSIEQEISKVMNYKGFIGQNILHVAVINEDKELLQLLLKDSNVKKQIDNPNEFGESALCCAIGAPSVNQDIVTQLLESKANPNSGIEGGSITPLTLAVNNGDNSTIRLMLKYCSTINFDSLVEVINSAGEHLGYIKQKEMLSELEPYEQLDVSGETHNYHQLLE